MFRVFPALMSQSIRSRFLAAGKFGPCVDWSNLTIHPKSELQWISTSHGAAGQEDRRPENETTKAPAASLFRAENSGMDFTDSNPFPESDHTPGLYHRFFDDQLFSDSSDSLFSDSFSENSVAAINPATGMLMVGGSETGFDTGGNAYGTSSDDAFQSPFDDPFDDPFR